MGMGGMRCVLGLRRNHCFIPDSAVIPSALVSAIPRAE